MIMNLMGCSFAVEVAEAAEKIAPLVTRRSRPAGIDNAGYGNNYV
jgi:hypothetical protein